MMTVSKKPSSASIKRAVASGCSPTSSSKPFKGVPVHSAVLIKSPPMRLEMQDKVMYWDADGRARMSSSVSVVGLSTRPSISSAQLPASTAGGRVLMSMR